MDSKLNLDHKYTIIAVLKGKTMSVTFKLKRKKRNRKHGFLKRMATHDGRQIINRRRARKESD